MGSSAIHMPVIVQNEKLIDTIIDFTVLLGAFYVAYKLLSVPKQDQLSFPHSDKIKQVAKSIENVSNIDDIVGSIFVKNRVKPLLEKEEYHSAVREGCIAFLDYIRQKTNIQKDGIELINIVFDTTKPILKFVNLTPPYMNNIDDKVIGLFRNIVSVIRTPAMHSSQKITKKEAFQKIGMISYCTELIEKNTEVVSYIDNEENQEEIA
jgi:uncharacterized protein (TIGR02391 family)